VVYIQIENSLEQTEAGAAIDRDLLIKTAHQVLLITGREGDVNLTIVIGDDRLLHSLNQDFREIDAPTDVLAFPSDETDPDTGIQYLGDVILSYPRAAAQAEAGGHEVGAEMQLLVVHGTLHLLGYDHHKAQDKDVMWALQAQILTKLGCAITPPPSAQL